MSDLEPGRLTRAQLLQYFVDAATPRQDWLVGMELERMGRDAKTGAPLAYDGPKPNIRALIEAYHQLRDGESVYEGPHIIGLNGDWGNISLEPGGQFEWSSRPYDQLAGLEAAYLEHQQAMVKLADQVGVHWLDVAVEPELALDQMHWMPKARYNIMRPFIGARGKLGHRMMTQTAAIQCAFDYENEADWRHKFLVAARLAPIAIALFANSSRVDGSASGYQCFRQAIWQDTDPDRCGLPSVVFEDGFDLGQWVDWLIGSPTIFRHRAKGRIATNGVRFSELMDYDGCDAVSMRDWETHVSTIFTEVRSYTYIEVRSADLQPPELAFSVPAFWAGLLYESQALQDAFTLSEAFSDYQVWTDAMDQAAKHGLDGQAGGRSLREWAIDLVGLSKSGLGRGATCAAEPERWVAHLDRLAEAKQF